MINNLENVQPFEQDYDEKIEPPSFTVLNEDFSILDTKLPKSSNKIISINEHALRFKSKFFPLSTIEDWNSWQWQIKNSITHKEQLEKFIRLNDNEKAYFEHPLTNDILPVRITPYYASLLYDESNHVLRKTVVPCIDEFLINKGEVSDPLAESSHQIAKNIVHRYPDRVLFLATGFCSTYCRYCTRSHLVAKDKCHIGIKAWQEGLNYIKDHTEVRDVLISGGDPFTMPDTHIEYLLSELRKIEHVEIIRIGTKTPVVLPQRITKNLVSILKKYHPLFVSIHFTHADEITSEVKEACARLSNAGIPLGSQTVLLRDINDKTETIMTLMHELLKIRVRPYYLYQCDPIPGSKHFRTSVQKGLDIMFALRGHTSGYAVPHYVIDAPGGGGKIPILPDYLMQKQNGTLILRNYEDQYFTYPDTE